MTDHTRAKEALAAILSGRDGVTPGDGHKAHGENGIVSVSSDCPIPGDTMRRIGDYVAALEAGIERLRAGGWNYDMDAAPEGDAVDISVVLNGRPRTVRSYKRADGTFSRYEDDPVYAWRAIDPAPLEL